MQSQSPNRLRPFRPTSFGRYTLLLPLAAGGMGEIFLARLEGGNEDFERLVAVKRILPNLMRDSEFVRRFFDEARILAKLNHGSIAQVSDAGVVDGQPFLALEYVDGKDLRKVAAQMRDRSLPLPLTFVLYVAVRVLDALAYAHRKRDETGVEIGLVHRDISPQNILVSYEGEVKIIDFGLAKSTLNAGKTNPSVVLGKFLYMSPEQARHEEVDRRSDIYSLGLCLYELISGTNPFEDSAPGELLARVTQPNIPSLHVVEPLCPGSVEAVVMKALSPDRSQRFQTAEEFRNRLLSCLLEIDPSAGPENVSRFMRETFQQEYQTERRLLYSLVQPTQPTQPTPLPFSASVTHPGLRSHTPSDTSPDADTGVLSIAAVQSAVEAQYPTETSVPMAGLSTIGSISPSPLSFAPTPRRLQRTAPTGDQETLPSIMVDETLTRAPVTRTDAARSRTEQVATAGPDQTIEEFDAEEFDAAPHSSGSHKTFDLLGPTPLPDRFVLPSMDETVPSYDELSDPGLETPKRRGWVWVLLLTLVLAAAAAFAAFRFLDAGQLSFRARRDEPAAPPPPPGPTKSGSEGDRQRAPAATEGDDLPLPEGEQGLPGTEVEMEKIQLGIESEREPVKPDAEKAPDSPAAVKAPSEELAPLTAPVEKPRPEPKKAGARPSRKSAAGGSKSK
jgi:serine/threonine protein kinase